MERPYRTISYPSCPYCKSDFSPKTSGYFGDLVGMVTGSGSKDVVVRCVDCGKKYRVTVLIKFNARKVKEDGSTN